MYLLVLLVASLALPAQANWAESCGGCKEKMDKFHIPGFLESCCQMTCNAHKDNKDCNRNCLKGFTCDGKDPAHYQGCKDKSPDCAKDMCGRRLGWDCGYCPVTCGQCDPNQNYEGCVDMLKSCPQVKRYCKKFDWVRTGCKKSCKKC